MGTNIVNTKVSQHDDIKQHLSNIWRSIHKKVKQHWGWVEKKNVAYKKSVHIRNYIGDEEKLKTIQVWQRKKSHCQLLY